MLTSKDLGAVQKCRHHRRGRGGVSQKWVISVTNLLYGFFSHPSLNPSLEICFVIPKEGIVTLRVAELLVPGCKEPSTLVRSPRHAVTRTGEGGSQ